MRYESKCCGSKPIPSEYFGHLCGKCYKVCDVVDNMKDPAYKERQERKRNRKKLVRMLNKRR